VVGLVEQNWVIGETCLSVGGLLYMTFEGGTKLILYTFDGHLNFISAARGLHPRTRWGPHITPVYFWGPVAVRKGTEKVPVPV